MLDPYALGPLNGGLLVVLAMLGVTMVVRSLRRLAHGEAVEALPLALVLVLPLVLAVSSAQVQLPLEVAAAKLHPNPAAKQTLWAMAIHRSLLTQFCGGVLVASGAFGLIGGSLVLTVPGERPRLALGQAGVVLGACFLFVAALGLSLEPSWVLVARLGLYIVAVFAVVSALIAAHRRGPGVQLAVVSAVAFPLLVAAVDQATIAWLVGTRLEQIALAPASERAALMDAAIASLGTMRGFSGAHLGVATGLALLGTAAAWRTERRVAWANLAALATVTVVAAAGVGLASTWLGGF